MKSLDGVARYITASGVVENKFPVDFKNNAFICCEFCNFYGLSTKRCRLTGEIILYGDKCIGHNCPLTLEEEE